MQTETDLLTFPYCSGNKPGLCFGEVAVRGLELLVISEVL